MANPQKPYRDEDFPKRLRQLISEDGRVLEVIAADVQVSKTNLSDWQTGKTMPRADSLRLLAKYFNVTTDYLLGLTDAQTVDTDLRAVADYTGLSEKAVQKLRHAALFCDTARSTAPTSTLPPDFISYIVESDYLSKMALGLITYYVYRTGQEANELFLADVVSSASKDKSAFDDLMNDPEDRVCKGFRDTMLKIDTFEAFEKYVKSFGVDAIVKRHPMFVESDKSSAFEWFKLQKTLDELVKAVEGTAIEAAKEEFDKWQEGGE